MANTFKDLLVKTGTFTNRDGEEKNRYENIGSLVEKDDGGHFIILKRTFNPAGVPNPDNKDSIIVSIFSKNEEKQHQETRRNDPPVSNIDDDDIPF